MALVKCPECGRENVSDSAESCPDCGFNIKDHFIRIQQIDDMIKKKKEEIKEARKAELKRREEWEKSREKEREIEEERMSKVAPFKKIFIAFPVLIIVAAFSCFCFGLIKKFVFPTAPSTEERLSALRGDSYYFKFGIPFDDAMIFIGIGLAILGAYLMYKFMKIYKLSNSNLKEYQKQVVLRKYAEEYKWKNNTEYKCLIDMDSDIDDEEFILSEIEKDKNFEGLIDETGLSIDLIKKLNMERDEELLRAFIGINEKLEYDRMNMPRCPYCNSFSVERVSMTSKIVSTAALGIASNKIGKQWKCKNCKSYF